MCLGAKTLHYSQKDAYRLDRAAMESQHNILRSSNLKPGYSHPLKKTVGAPVHCELAAAFHFLSRNQKGPPPLPFVGVSKLSCIACWGFFRCLQDSGVRLFTRGTHGKAYFPCKYPGTELSKSTCRDFAGTINQKTFLPIGCQIYNVHSLPSMGCRIG